MRLTSLGHKTVGFVFGVGVTLAVATLWPAPERANRTTCGNLRTLAIEVGAVDGGESSHQDGWNVLEQPRPTYAPVGDPASSHQNSLLEFDPTNHRDGWNVAEGRVEWLELPSKPAPRNLATSW